MTDPVPDPEFEEFLRRRRPLFRRDVDDGLEPPPELDRVVLRQAYEAIQPEKPLRLYRGPRWAAPIAIAATLVLGLAVVFQAGNQQQQQRIPEVTVESVAQRLDDSQPPMENTATPAAQVADTPAWRRDAQTWLTEIERLRAAGHTAAADAEMAEYNRQHRAFAGTPDR
jgi:hypothetical protein